jgi:membrane-associated phospholipid phosphatase
MTLTLALVLSQGTLATEALARPFPGEEEATPASPLKEGDAASQRSAPTGTSPNSVEPARHDTSTHDGALSRFMDQHGWRLAFSLGVSVGGALYGKYVGFSREPLLFEETPGFDKAIRATLNNGNGYNGFINLYSLNVLKYGGAIGLISMDFGSGHEMAGDLFGFIDATYTNRGATSLLKDIVGRKRPGLQFADPATIGQPAYDALNAQGHYHRSFPSGHSSGSFTMVSYLERAIARKVGVHSLARKFTFLAFYGVAAYIGYTRIDQDEHFFSDVLAGAALGTFEGRTFYRLEHKDEFARGNRSAAQGRAFRLRFYPVQLVDRGAAMMVGIRFGADQP